MLINCAAYRNGDKVADFGVEAISHWLAQPGCFVWVALRDATPDELHQVQQQLDLPDLAVEDALHGHQRPKIEEYTECLFVVLHMVEPQPEGGLGTGELAIFTGANFVLSIRNRSSRGFLGVRARVEREPELLKFGPGYVLYALMDAVVDRYFPLLEDLEAKLAEIEDEIFSGQGRRRGAVERLYLLKRTSTPLKQAVAPLLHDIGRLHGGRVPVQVMAVQEYVRDVADHLNRINAGIDTLRDTIATAVQVNLSLATIEDSAVTKQLAAWASIFAVWTAFAGIWGMNFEFMPELGWKYGYLLALGVIGSACAALYLRFRRIGWL